MADDPNPALRAELNAALAVLAPEIRGLQQLLTTTTSDSARAILAEQLADKVRRRDLIAVVLADQDKELADLNALEADGYPDVSPMAVSNAVFEELAGEQTDIGAALGTLTERNVAAGPLTVSPNPTPPTKPGP